MGPGPGGEGWGCKVFGSFRSAADLASYAEFDGFAVTHGGVEEDGRLLVCSIRRSSARFVEDLQRKWIDQPPPLRQESLVRSWGPDCHKPERICQNGFVYAATGKSPAETRSSRQKARWLSR